jgi:hypothetical protein
VTADPPTRLVLPVPELAGSVPGAHIVLLAPFLGLGAIDAGVVSELRDFFADVTPFAYVLTEATRFPSGAPYLPPQPVAVFRRIFHSLRRTFPEVVGIPTSFDTVVPHLLLPEGTEVSTPVEVHAREAVLVHGEGHDVTTLATFRFGESAA